MSSTNNGWKPMSTRELAKRSGIPRATVAELSLKTSWQGIRVDLIDRFSTACGVDLLRIEPAIERLRKHKKPYLTRGRSSQRAFYYRLMIIVKERNQSAA